MRSITRNAVRRLAAKAKRRGHFIEEKEVSICEAVEF